MGKTLSNPYVLDDAFDALDHALTRAISTIEGDTHASGASAESETLLSKFRGWQSELVQLRRKGGQGAKGIDGGRHAVASGGGLFAD